MDLISVIVPVYKVEKYLDKCVSSIINQTHRNLEIILVDDGSPDHCGAMCDAWAEKDSRIKVIHQENAGGGAARNAALDMARGELIAFVDSDDYIAPDMYEHLYKLIATGADIAEFAPNAKEGYTFNGWTDMPADKKMPEKDLVVHADWSANKNDITLNAGEGEFADGTSVFTETGVEYGEKLSGIVPAEPTREGYTFKGWVDAQGNPATIPATMPDAPIDLTAKWEIKSATVTFDAGEGAFADGTSKATASGDYGTDITLPAEPTRECFNIITFFS